MPRSEGEKGEQKSGGYAAADFLFGTFSFVRW